MKKVKLAVCLLLAHTAAFAQTPPDMMDNESGFNNRETVASEIQAAISGTTQINTYQGTPNISIPVYTIKQQDFSLPISLQYNASGIKVSQQASCVGLGWQLQAGGQIQRIVQGYADDIGQLSSGISTDKKAGYLVYAGLAGLVDGFNPAAGTFANAFTLAENFLYSATGRYKAYDTEPDIYAFNMNGKAGYFFFDKNGVPQTIPYKDYKIEYTTGSAAVGITDFTITDEAGVKYKFDVTTVYDQSGVLDITMVSEQSSTIQSLCGYSSLGPSSYVTYPNRWYLSKITLPNTEEIQLNYEADNYNDFSTSYSARNCPSDFDFGDLSNGSGRDLIATLFAPHYTTGKQTYVKRLKEIISKNYKIVFEANTQRQDVPNIDWATLGNYAISDIKIYSLKRDASNAVTTTTLRRKYHLNYSYFQSSSSYPGDYSRYQAGTLNPDKRLKLDNFQILDAGTGSVSYKYDFTYDTRYILPPRYSNEQDLWGYYNRNSTRVISGSNPNSSAVTLLPKLYVYPNESGTNRFRPYPLPGYAGTAYTYEGADRSTNDSFISLGTLTKITYPTGGSVNYFYEPNEFLSFGVNIKGCGIRVKEMVLTDGISSNNDIHKYYNYTLNGTASSGVLYDFPMFAYTDNKVVWHNNNKNTYSSPGINGYPDVITYHDYQPWVSGVTNKAYYDLFTIRLSHPRFNSSTYSGNHMGYAKVTESINGVGGYTEYTFSTPGAYNKTNDDPSGGCVTTISGSTPVDGVCNNLYEVPTAGFADYKPTPGATNVWSCSTDGMGLGQFTLPFAPSLNYDWARGKPLSKKVYYNSSNLLKEYKYTYQVYSKNTTFADNYTWGLRMVITDNAYYNEILNYDPIWTPFPEARYLSRSIMPVYCKYRVISNVDLKPIETEEITYDNPNSSFVSQKTKYYYESSKHAFVTKKDDYVSNDEMYTTHFSYPPDYNTTSSSSSDPTYFGVQVLNDRHIISPVIESYTERKNQNGTNNRIVDGMFIAYQKYITASFLPLPAEAYKMELAIPLSSYTPVIITTSGVTKSSAYHLLTNFDNYSINGATKQATSRGELPAAIIWGYNNSLPVAQVQNAAINQVAYVGFEDLELLGNWDLHTISLNTSKAFTGKISADLSTSGDIKTHTDIPSGDYVLSFWSDNTTSGNFNVTVTGTSGSGTPVVTLVKQLAATATGYRYYEYKISNPYTTASVTVKVNSTTINLDELRLYPVYAAMSTSAYDKVDGVISTCDAQNNLTNYEYDALGRVVLLRDKDNNIVKKLDYSIQQPE